MRVVRSGDNQGMRINKGGRLENHLGEDGDFWVLTTFGISRYP